ncbi:5'-nucleotidase [Filimonas lacunae]|nr:5'-nucleotidase [Filimonas lacunae]
MEYKDYEVNKTYVPDTGIQQLLLPYRDSVNRAMGKKIGVATQSLTRKLPESTLGNLMADCMREKASQKFNTNVDAAFVNYYGIRADLPQGDIVLGNIYELMPFDNLIVLQRMKGSVLREFLNLVASKGGWPVSGIQMQIKDKQATNILVNGKPLDDAADYLVANSDYVANGGDDCKMLKPIAQQSKGYLYRDALIEYIRALTQAGKPVSANIENRVTYVN